MQKIDREIYEWGELERDAAQLADFSPHGGILYRFWKWLESQIREERETLIEDRQAIRHPGKEGGEC